MLWHKAQGAGGLVGGGGGGGDPDFANVELLLHGDGVDGSTTFTDSSSNALSLTVNGSAQIDTTTVKYGTGSMQFTGSGDYATLSSPPTSLIDWHSSDFTIEAWVYANSFSTWGLQIPLLVGNMAATSGINYWSFGPLSNGVLCLYYWKGSQTFVYSTETLTTDAWNHIAMVNSSGTITLYVNGVGSTGTAISGTPLTSSGTPFNVNGYSNSYFVGYVDDLRITSGVARYTENFTPPTEAFPDSAEDTGGGGGGGGSFTNTYVGPSSVSSAGGASSYTFSAADLGSNPTKIFVVMSDGAGGPRKVTSATIDGVSCTVYIAPDVDTAWEQAAVIVAEGVSATTGDIVLNFDGAVNGEIFVAKYDSTSTNISVDMTSNQTDFTAAGNTGAAPEAFVIGFVCGGSGSSPQDLTGVTEDIVFQTSSPVARAGSATVSGSVIVTSSSYVPTFGTIGAVTITP